MAAKPLEQLGAHALKEISGWLQQGDLRSRMNSASEAYEFGSLDPRACLRSGE